MFSSSVIPGILAQRPENVIEDEVYTRPAAITEQQPGITSWRRERTSIGMTKHNIKPSQNSASPALPEARAESLDLVMLYEKYKRPIHTYIYRLLASQEDADDLTQEVFMRAFVSWPELYDRNNLSPWLYRIATNLCVDLLRRRRRISWWPLARRHMNDQQLEHGIEEDAPYLPANSGGIPEVFEREHIRLALASMPEDYATVLVLNAAQGVPYQDIATIVGISPNAAATRISRAKRMFAEQYERLNEEKTSKRGKQG